MLDLNVILFNIKCIRMIYLLMVLKAWNRSCAVNAEHVHMRDGTEH